MRKFRPTQIACATCARADRGKRVRAVFQHVHLRRQPARRRRLRRALHHQSRAHRADVSSARTSASPSTPFTANGNDYAHRRRARQLAARRTAARAFPISRWPRRSTCSSRKGPLDRNALYQMNGGGNDIFNAFVAYVQSGRRRPRSGHAGRPSRRRRSTSPRRRASSRRRARSTWSCRRCPTSARRPLRPRSGRRRRRASPQLSRLFNATLNRPSARPASTSSSSTRSRS